MRIALSFFIFLPLLISSCSKPQQPHSPPAIPVKMARATQQHVPLYIETVGHIEPYKVVDIMAQVNGQLVTTYFQDGADIQKGDLLYEIDKRPYTAELERSEGELLQNIAALEYAQNKAKRYSKLLQEEYISQDDYDNLITSVAVKEAAVTQSRANVKNATINLGYTTIYSPMDARAGKSYLDNGNLVLEASKTPLVTLNQITPIYATFFINEKDLAKVQKKQTQHSPLKVYVTDDSHPSSTYEGTLTFIDNVVDLSTGMIRLRATFPNINKSLWPHQYVKVKLVLEELENSVLIPFDAVQTSATGKYVYVIKGNKRIEMRPITIGQMQDGNTIVVTQGLKAGEKVVQDGQINLYPGAQVTLTTGEEEE